MLRGIDNMSIKILHILNDETGGIKTITNELLNLFPNSKVLNLNTKGFFKVIFSFRNITRSYDIIHFHGAWGLHIILSLFTSKPVVISPHGSFHPNGLKKSKIKKLIAKFLYVKFCYKRADIIHALTQQEVKFIKDFCLLKQKIAVICNAVDFNERILINDTTKNKLLRLANGRRIFLYLGRLDPQKGIDLLIEVFSEICNKSAVLLIAGSGDTKFIQKLKNKIIANNLQDNVFLLGYFKESNKNSAFDVADIYVLPSFNEGFTMTVLESYRQKTPVITTTATPFEEIDKMQFGWYIKPDKIELKKAIDLALSIKKQEINKLGENGYTYMKNHYDISNFSHSYNRLYSWILGYGNKPEFIVD